MFVSEQRVRDLEGQVKRILSDYIQILKDYQAVIKVVQDNDKLTKLVNNKLQAIEKCLDLIYINGKYHKRLK
jgi:hypothetical protein